MIPPSHHRNKRRQNFYWSPAWLGSLGIGLLWLVIRLSVKVFGPERTTLPASVDEIFSTTLRIRSNLRPEPVERLCYLIALFALPVIAWLLSGLACRIREGRLNLDSARLQSGWLYRGWDLFLCVLALGVAPFLYNTELAKYLFGTKITSRFGFGLILFFTVLICVTPFSRYLNKRQSGPNNQRWAITFFGVLGMAACIISFRIFGVAVLDSSGIWSTHFDASLYALTQVVHGGTALAEVSPQYGLYCEILAPVFRLIPLSVFSYTIMMGLILLSAYTAAARALSLCIRNPVIYATMILGLAALYGNILADTSYTWDAYFQYYPIRLIFPALAVWWVGLLPSPVISSGQAIIAGLIGAIAMIWNLDTGVPVFCSLAMVVALGCFTRIDSSARWSALRRIREFACAAFAIWAVFLMYLWLKAGEPLHPSLLLKYQLLFYSYGFAMLPLPLTPHAWMAVAGIYVLGFTIGLGMCVWRPSRIGRMMMFLSVLGLGLFSYYQGRSHDLVLIAVAWPALLMAGLMADQVLRAVKAGLAPKYWVLVAVPLLMPAIFLSARWFNQLPAMFHIAQVHWELRNTPRDPALVNNIEFIRSRTQRKDKTVILGSQQATYLAECDLGFALSGPGRVEMLTREDHKWLIEGLRNYRGQGIFVAKDFSFPFFPELNGELLQVFHEKYICSEMSEDGMCYMVPIDGTEYASMPRLTKRRNQISPSQGGWSSFPYLSQFRAPVAFSIELIVRPSALQVPYAAIIGNHPGSADNTGFVLQKSPGAPTAYHFAAGDGKRWFFSDLQLVPDQWNYVVLTLAEKKLQAYVNGVSAAEREGPAHLADSDFPVMAFDWQFSGRHFSGQLAGIEISAGALSANEVAETWRHLK